MRFEHFSQPVIPLEQWLQRVLRSAWLAFGIASTALIIGIIGYHELGDMQWIDATLEASMILGGMGPVASMTNDAVKIFASVYALFSGLVLLATMGILLTPWVHRMLHHFYNDRRKANRGGQRRRAADHH